MNTDLFIAKRIFDSEESKNRLSHRIINIALLGIILGFVVIIISLAIVSGYKLEVGRKVIGFGSHLQIINLDSNQSFETSPISQNQEFLSEIKSIAGIKHIQVFATKPGIVKTDDEIQGVYLKGIGSDFDWSFFEENKVAGRIFELKDTVRNNEVWISLYLADLLKLSVDDDLFMFFLNESESVARQRKFKIAGIYKTSLEEFDKMFVLADINHVRRLNNWEDDEISGFEILVDDFSKIEMQNVELSHLLLRYTKPDEAVLQVVSIKEKYRHIFDWLNLLDMNVWVILGLLILVAGFNMVSGLLVIILERTQMIGILKAIGARNWSIRRVFLYFSALLILKALFWGNLIGLSIYFIQKYTQVLKLDPSTYYIEYVPVDLSIFQVLFLNIGTIAVTCIMLLVPSYFITKVSPEKTIRFE